MLCSGAAILAGILRSLEVLGSFLGSGGGPLKSRGWARGYGPLAIVARKAGVLSFVVCLQV